MVSHWFFVYIF